MLEIGVAKTDITTYEPALGMMGWGMLHNVVESVATPLHARAFALVEPSPPRARPLVLVCCDLAFISLALRRRVLDRLAERMPEAGLGHAEVVLMATHTHSGPGGFTHYPFYNITIPGFCASVLEGLAQGIATAIEQAYRGRRPGQVRYAEGAFEPDVPVAWNRSIEAYNRNPEVVPVGPGQRAVAIDRTMRLLRFDDADGRPLGSINWFGVHGTNVHSDNTALHFDNKGYAAQELERAMARRGHGGYVAAFAQGSTGDVTPNDRRHPGRPFMRGRHPDDDDSARFNGRLQATLALELVDAAERATPLAPRLMAAHAFEDFSCIDVDPRFAGGRTGLRTAPAEIGMAMFFGTEEGPGLPRSLRSLQGVVMRARERWRRLRPPETFAEHAATQAEKIPWVESGRRRILGMARLRRLPLPWRAHPALRLVRALDEDEPDAKPWTPAVLPVHVAMIGAVAIAAAPAEITTVAGRRIRATVAEALAARGVTHTVLCGHANAYSGYVTTPEEYELQDYEGASTHFGKWTLPAYQTVFDRVARRLGEPAPVGEPVLEPPRFSERELMRRAFPATGARP
ncbi:neutral/alkaline non-lysosomal ceramidase N-terminal domain-containing protein [Paraliomyxa miuraensis]|uniref:neutral/alkaline non-lysosomal ceramidase N-terminal domain-containing protein n=1 Tax=Paraliomyxa miuraensis TaxID=376150 RepID=UPI00224CFB21|nr:neutral/alkaline non-lysosomal ceramidase N-terminal domain-containing protein [Paraliomyxa miuraensis]MCX4244758.1 neutral/alkaline non-lysosomal ceramidase N-terminal domain-containing protein [Paraliomyxa miuraensis]